MSGRPTPHLTAAMKDAAERYAARLLKRHPDLSAQEAMDEARRLARLDLLTADGYKKRGRRR